jgi:hypothetical protein
MFSCGGFDAVIAAMEAHGADVEVQISGCRALLSMSTREDLLQGGLFDAAPASAFGAPPVAPVNTRSVPYIPIQLQDVAEGAAGASPTYATLAVITAMPQHRSKSFEELRFEDYAQGVKGGSGVVTGSSWGCAVPTAMQTIAAATLAHRAAMPLLIMATSALHALALSAPPFVLGVSCAASAVLAVITAMHVDAAHAVTSIHSEGCATLSLLAFASATHRATAVAAGALDAVSACDASLPFRRTPPAPRLCRAGDIGMQCNRAPHQGARCWRSGAGDFRDAA